MIFRLWKNILDISRGTRKVNAGKALRGKLQLKYMKKIVRKDFDNFMIWSKASYGDTAFCVAENKMRRHYLLEVVKFLLQDLNLLQVRANLFISEGALLLIDPLLELIGLAEQHELLAALLQHILALLPQLQQCTVPLSSYNNRI